MKNDVPDPWLHLATYWPEVVVEFADLHNLRGYTTWPEDGGPPYITLNRRLTQVQRRCTLAHETRHLERGMPCQGYRAQDEARVRRATARWLLPAISLVAAAVATMDIFTAAESLWVTVPVLMDRLRYQTDVEHQVMLDLEDRRAG